MIEPAREAAVEPLFGAAGDEIARVVRGDDGVRFLETRSLAVVDLAAPPGDARDERKLGWTLFAVMFGASAPRAKAEPPADPIAPLRAWVAEEAARGARVYRTAAGFRLLVTAPPLDPSGAESDALLTRLGVGGAARRARRAEGRYRVRLTPPDGLAGCRFVEALGRAAQGEAAQVVELHDLATRAFDRLPLG